MDALRKNALLSVFNKDGIAEFARGLSELGFRIWSSGGTARHLMEDGLSVTDIATLVGPPILGHRVVTLSREIHAGLLAQDTAEDRAELARINAPWFEVVCVDLYPLEAEIARDGATLASVKEKTDIGGPTLLRSAAKGGRLVIVDPEDRATVLHRLRHGKAEDPQYRVFLAAKAERMVSRYSGASANYLEHFQHPCYQQ